MEIDVREIQLGKWYVPKQTGALSELEEQVHVIGYIDILEIRTEDNYKEELDKDKKSPLLRAYEGSFRNKKDLQEKYFIQEIKAFTNITDDEKKGFSREKLEKFWGSLSPALCMSMLHLQHDVKSEKLVKRLREVFGEIDYLYYYTFDYSGILVFVKNISYKEYLEKLFQLNYEYLSEEHIIKDIFSIYGFQKEKLERIFEQFHKNVDKKDILNEIKEKEEYEISVNISIQYYTQFLEFKKNLSQFEMKNGYEPTVYYEMLGRHDISLVNKKADMVWLLYLQYLTDIYTSEDNKAFFAYESFVKVPYKQDYIDKSLAFEDEVNEKLKAQIKKVYKIFRDCAEQFEEYERYCIPIKEICNSIISILNNDFAIDFVLCMFQSFFELVLYLKNKIVEDKEKHSKEENDIFELNYTDEFENCFSSYLDGLNSLINSTIHTERQFIQTTSFSAIFYDVPPKLMAFYVATINHIRSIISCENDKHYTFLMTPSFSDEIRTKVISYKENNLPSDRILKISINEQSLYKPGIVIRRMAHEIAHYVGDGLRNRELRKKTIIKIYIDYILELIFPYEFYRDDDFRTMRSEICEKIKNIEFFTTSKNNYTKDLATLHNEILAYMVKDDDIIFSIKKFVEVGIGKMLRNKELNYLELLLESENELLLSIDLSRNNVLLSELELRYLTEIVMRDIRKVLNELVRKERVLENAGSRSMISCIKTGNKEYCSQLFLYHKLERYAKSLLSLYKETFADLQMILLLNTSYTVYLKSFACDEGMELKNIEENNEDISRIAVVARLMFEYGHWRMSIDSENVRDNKIQELHKKVCRFQKEMLKEENEYYYQNNFLFQYLKKCMDESILHYNNKPQLLQKEIRKNAKIMENYEDAAEVYEIVCKTLYDYKNELSNLVISS